MKRNFLVPILVTSIALTSFGATPVQAGTRDDQFGQFIAGAIFLAIIGKVIEDNKRSTPPRHVAHPAPRPAPKPVPPRPAPPPRFNKYLPGECLFNVRERFGARDVYGKRCLHEKLTFGHARHLPRQCEDRVLVRQGRQADVYDARCLSRYGYRDEAWRRR